MSTGRLGAGDTAIQPTIVDAKGDLITATAADTPARLAVGTNEHRLVAASGEATGLKYVADTTNYAIAAKGDLLVGTAADTLQALSVGTNGHTLVADSAQTTGVKWAAPSTPSFVGCQLYASSQTVLGNTYNVLAFANENFDTDGFHSTTTNNSRITIPTGKGGKYLFITNQRWETNDAVGSFIQVNGSRSATGLEALDQGFLSYIVGTGGNTLYGSTAVFLLNLVATDYVEVGYYLGNVTNKTCSDASFGCIYLGA